MHTTTRPWGWRNAYCHLENDYRLVEAIRKHRRVWVHMNVPALYRLAPYKGHVKEFFQKTNSSKHVQFSKFFLEKMDFLARSVDIIEKWIHFLILPTNKILIKNNLIHVIEISISLWNT